MGLAVVVDGKEVLRQTCLFDVRRHQLAFSGKQGKVEGTMERPEPAATTVRVDPARRHQIMLGFGGLTSAPAFRELSEEGKRRWWQLLKDYNLLLHREYPMGARLRPDQSNAADPRDATPHYYGDNFPNGEVSDFEYIRQVRRLGGKVLFEFWDLPPWAGEPAAYARAVRRYCEMSRERAGAPPDIVGIQNERTHPAEVWQESLFGPDPARGFVPVASSYQLRVFGAYSRKVREGMVRVEATASDPDLLATAFEGADGSRTLVLLNRSGRAQQVGVEWKGARLGVRETADPYRENAAEGAGSGRIVVEAGSVVTLGGSGGEGVW